MVGHQSRLAGTTTNRWLAHIGSKPKADIYEALLLAVVIENPENRGFSCRFVRLLSAAQLCVCPIPTNSLNFCLGALFCGLNSSSFFLYRTPTKQDPSDKMCIRDSDYSYTIDNNLTMDTLLGKELANLAQVEHIKFNSIANRFLKKTIGQLVKSERNVFNKIPYKELTEFMDEIIKIGDIRSVIFNLEMWATNYLKEAKWYNRENQINLFHAIGKIIYLSSEFSELSSDERDYNSVEQVLANYTNNQLLNMAILENYLIYNCLLYTSRCV